MQIILPILFFILAIAILAMVLLTKKGEYITSSYKVNPYIDNEGCIELIICDPYLNKKNFFVSYKYSAFLESKGDICVTFLQVPIIHRKPIIQDVYINKIKIND